MVQRSVPDLRFIRSRLAARPLEVDSMTKPTISAVDDRPVVSGAITPDLRAPCTAPTIGLSG
jgi:hypothetical protein